MKINWNQVAIGIVFVALAVFMIDLILTGGFWK